MNEIESELENLNVDDFPSYQKLAPHGGCNWVGCRECFPTPQRTTMLLSDLVTEAEEQAEDWGEFRIRVVRGGLAGVFAQPMDVKSVRYNVETGELYLEVDG